MKNDIGIKKEKNNRPSLRISGRFQVHPGHIVAQRFFFVLTVDLRLLIKFEDNASITNREGLAI